MAKVCIICRNESDGRAVADDFVINTIRRIKQFTHTAKNNTLVVCSGCLEAYAKKRADYEKTIAIYVIISAAMIVLLTVLPLMTSGFSLYSFLLGIALAAFFMALPILTRHIPRLADSASQSAKANAKESKPKKALGGKKK